MAQVPQRGLKDGGRPGVRLRYIHLLHTSSYCVLRSMLHVLVRVDLHVIVLGRWLQVHDVSVPLLELLHWYCLWYGFDLG